MFLIWCVECLLLYFFSICTCLCAGVAFDCFKAMEIHERELTKEVRDVAKEATQAVREIRRAGKVRLKEHSHRLTGILFNVIMLMCLAWIVYEIQNIEDSSFNKSALIKYGGNKNEFGKAVFNDYRYLDYLMSVLFLGSSDGKFYGKSYPGVRNLSWLKHGTQFLEQSKIFLYPSSIQRFFQEYIQQKPKSELMKYEWARYETFKTFPQWSPAMPTRLAASGFYYTGCDDEVTCFSCGVKHRCWKDDEIPSAVHMSLRPDCHMVLDPSRVNVPIDDPESVPTVGGAHKLLVKIECNKSQKENVENIGSASAPDLRNEANYFQSNEIFFSNSKHPEFAELSARLDSFLCWPIGDIIKPEHLADAGFYYAGFGDCVRCYHCGGGLRNWDKGDCVWTEHARVFPSCEYIIHKIGRNSKWLKGQDRDVAETTSIKASSNIQDGALRHRTTSQESSADSHVLIRNQNSTRQDRNITTSDFYKTYAGNIVTQPGCSQKIVEKPEKNAKADKKGNEKDIKALRQHVMCKICMDQYSEVVFLPCGHLIACRECALNIRKCAICRTKINGRVRALMS